MKIDCSFLFILSLLVSQLIGLGSVPTGNKALPNIQAKPTVVKSTQKSPRSDKGQFRILKKDYFRYRRRLDGGENGPDDVVETEPSVDPTINEENFLPADNPSENKEDQTPESSQNQEATSESESETSPDPLEDPDQPWQVVRLYKSTFDPKEEYSYLKELIEMLKYNLEKAKSFGKKDIQFDELDFEDFHYFLSALANAKDEAVEGIESKPHYYDKRRDHESENSENSSDEKGMSSAGSELDFDYDLDHPGDKEVWLAPRHYKVIKDPNYVPKYDFDYYDYDDNEIVYKEGEPSKNEENPDEYDSEEDFYNNEEEVDPEGEYDDSEGQYDEADHSEGEYDESTDSEGQYDKASDSEGQYDEENWETDSDDQEMEWERKQRRNSLTSRSRHLLSKSAVDSKKLQTPLADFHSLWKKRNAFVNSSNQVKSANLQQGRNWMQRQPAHSRNRIMV